MFRQFIKNFDQAEVGIGIPFYRSPMTIAKIALMLHERLNPKQYKAIIPMLSAIRFSQEQKNRRFRALSRFGNSGH